MTYMNYEYFKEKYESIKPIRGRSVDTRPIDRRTRDWELIIKTEMPDGTVAYGAQLYHTEVVRYLADGTIQMRIDTWATPITADFMQRWSPFGVRKAQKNIWVRVPKTGKEYPVPVNSVLEFKMRDGVYELVTGLPETLKQKVVDRTLSKQMRQAYKPFVDYATTFLKLSEGWVMHDTFAPYMTKSDTDWTGWQTDLELPDLVAALLRNRDYYADKPDNVMAFKEMVESNDTLQWDRLMLGILFHATGTEDSRTVREESFQIKDRNYTRTRRWHDLRFRINSIERFVNYLIKKDPTIYTTRDVAVGCVHHNLVI